MSASKNEQAKRQERDAASARERAERAECRVRGKVPRTVFDGRVRRVTGVAGGGQAKRKCLASISIFEFFFSCARMNCRVSQFRMPQGPRIVNFRPRKSAFFILSSFYLNEISSPWLEKLNETQ